MAQANWCTRLTITNSKFPQNRFPCSSNSASTGVKLLKCKVDYITTCLKTIQFSHIFQKTKGQTPYYQPLLQVHLLPLRITPIPPLWAPTIPAYRANYISYITPNTHTSIFIHSIPSSKKGPHPTTEFSFQTIFAWKTWIQNPRPEPLKKFSSSTVMP